MIPNHISENYFDYSMSTFDNPQISETTIRVLVNNLEIVAGYPGYPSGKIIDHCTLVYEGVVRSERRIHEYYDEPEYRDGRKMYRIKSKHTISDGPFAEVNGEVFLFTIQGILKDPHAWLSWEIVAESVRIEDQFSE